MSQISWFDDEDDNDKLLAEGIYSVILTNATLDETKQDDRISIEFTHDNKRKSWLNLTFAENRKKFVNWQLRELGVYERGKEIAIAKGQSPARSMLEALAEIIGVKCEISIEHNEWNGKTYANVKVESTGILPQAPTPPAPVRQAAGRTPPPRPTPRGPVSARPTTAPQTSAPPSFDSNEEIPF